MKKILVLVGTRPEVIKLAPVIRALRRRAADFETLVCSTGQHREMLDQTMREFGLKADVDLALMTPGQTLAGITSLAFAAIDQALGQIRPDAVVVQGDTTSAMAGASCGYYRRLEVGHVEAGLRSGNIHAPFPEEVNRCFIGKVASHHFAPTVRAAANLRREGVADTAIHVTGNTVVDALNWMRDRLPVAPPDDLPPEVVENLDRHRLLLVTSHRRESFGEAMACTFRALRCLVNRFPDTAIVYPVHLNPNVRFAAHELLSDHPRIHLLPPVPYTTLLWLMRRSTLILSDSGGIQEEAPSFGKPLLVLRDTTERPEVVESGCAVLVGTGEDAIVSHASRLLSDVRAWASMAERPNPFGDGHAADRIAGVLCGAPEVQCVA